MTQAPNIFVGWGVNSAIQKTHIQINIIIYYNILNHHLTWAIIPVPLTTYTLKPSTPPTLHNYPPHPTPPLSSRAGRVGGGGLNPAAQNVVAYYSVTIYIDYIYIYIYTSIYIKNINILLKSS